MQVWLDVVAIVNGSLLGFGSGERNIAEHWFLLFIFSKSQAAVPGGRNANATPAQSPVVVRHFKQSIRLLKQEK